MSHLVTNISNLGRRIDRGVFAPVGKAISKFDPALGWVLGKSDIAAQNAVLGKPQYGNYYGQAAPPPPGPPTQDTAANAAMQQQTLLRRRRGVYGNIMAGNAPAPTVASKSTLGT